MYPIVKNQIFTCDVSGIGESLSNSPGIFGTGLDFRLCEDVKLSFSKLLSSILILSLLNELIADTVWFSLLEVIRSDPKTAS